MKQFLFWIAVLLFSSLTSGYVKAGSADTTGSGNSPLTWLKPPATAEELKMYKTLKADPDRIQDFVKMRMIFRILGYPTQKEHENVGRRDGAVQNLVLPEIHVSDMNYVFNKDEQILRYNLNSARSREGMGLSDLTKVTLTQPDYSPLSGDEISQWNQVTSDTGNAGGKPVSWEICITGDSFGIESKYPLIWSMGGCLYQKNAPGNTPCLYGHPVHLHITIPPNLLKDLQPVNLNGTEIPFINRTKAGLGKDMVIHITDGYVDKRLYKMGYESGIPDIEVLKYEPIQ